MNLNQLVLAFGAAGIISLSGCSDSDPVTDSTSLAPQTTYSVKAIDGYLRNAVIWLDVNQNNQLDTDSEPNTTTGAGGVGVLDVTGITDYEQYSLFVQAIPGETIDEATISEANPEGVAVQSAFMMSAPAGEAEVTPLSTMVNVLMHKNPDAMSDPDQAAQLKQQAVMEVADQLGIDPDSVLGDFVADEQEEAVFAARAVVESGHVLPTSSEEFDSMLQQVEEQAEDATVLKVIESINEEIKTVVAATPADQLATTDSPVSSGTDMSTDTDTDGVPDELDSFPDDADEYLDSDRDGTGNNADDDDDNDGFLDTVDSYPTDKFRAGDHDGDGSDSLIDNDDDGDGFNDDIDQFALDKTKAGDHDGDSVDSVDDAFPNDSGESVDTDGDGMGNNADPDDDNDTYLDGVDQYPTDPDKAGDFDGDGIDVIDDQYPNDTDNDGSNNDVDKFPDDPNETSDFDNDGQGDNADLDDDNDGVNDTVDNCPWDSNPVQEDFDNDGIGDVCESVTVSKFGTAKFGEATWQ
ncbi:thrombospondin type 3 repeat-containing protein [Vibrio hannami]|uniref:thrombospondin type 3 repeat-containing protein n=1 Tax=Vibrio hannami TaxID=2717094 RepID=UPI00240FC87C|nr:thrombospondin type 3 repeat-containing protein [Vibrio hannami]MDG3085446.1 thrombospondin type 3 repeat-containing protein [Vibrio hannami]